MTRIIRATHQGPPPPRRPNPERVRILTLKEQHARAEAEQILARARAEAASILEQAQREAMEIQQRAAESGRAKAARLMVAAEEHARERTLSSREELIDLATGIAAKILGEQLERDPRLMTAVAERCLAQCATARRITLRVNPADLEAVEGALPRLKEGTEAQVLNLTADDTISRGGCILDTEIGQIDGQLQTQLQAIREALSHE